MAYEIFQSRVNAIVAKVGGGISVQFSNEDGRYIARCSDGVRIIGNSISSKVRVEWGSGHAANALI